MARLEHDGWRRRLDAGPGSEGRRKQLSWRDGNEALLFGLLIAAAWSATVVDWPWRREWPGEPRVHRDPGADLSLGLSLLDLEILPRSAWEAARPGARPAPLGRPARLTVHHGGATVFRDTDQEACARRIRGIQRYHQEERGWADIGYHIVVDPAGRIWEGRHLATIGAHAGNRIGNTANIGILCLGNFDLQEPAPAQTRALLELIRRIREIWGIPVGGVLTHGEVREQSGAGKTACPGKALRGVVEAYRREAAPSGR